MHKQLRRAHTILRLVDYRGWLKAGLRIGSSQQGQAANNGESNREFLDCIAKKLATVHFYIAQSLANHLLKPP